MSWLCHVIYSLVSDHTTKPWAVSILNNTATFRVISLKNCKRKFDD